MLGVLVNTVEMSSFLPPVDTTPSNPGGRGGVILEVGKSGAASEGGEAGV